MMRESPEPVAFQWVPVLMPATFYIKHYHPLMCWHIEYLTPLRLKRDSARSVLIFGAGYSILHPRPAKTLTLPLPHSWTYKHKEACAHSSMHVYDFIHVYVKRPCACCVVLTWATCVCRKWVFLSWSHPFRGSVSDFTNCTAGMREQRCFLSTHIESGVDTLRFSGLVWNFALQHLLLNHFHLSVTLSLLQVLIIV